MSQPTLLCPLCLHEVRTIGDRFAPHDTEGLEPIGEGYWSGDNAEGVGHVQCRPRGSDARVTEANGYGYSLSIEDDDAEEIAHAWAVKYHSHLDWPSEMECVVLRPDGTVCRVVITVEMEPVFATRKEASHV